MNINDAKARLKKIRTTLGLTQGELGSLFDVDRRTVFHWETIDNGRNTIPLDKMYYLETFGISSGWILTGEGVMFKRMVEDVKGDILKKISE